MAELTREQRAAADAAEAAHPECKRQYDEATKTAETKRDAAIKLAHSEYNSEIAAARRAYIASPGYLGELGSV